MKLKKIIALTMSAILMVMPLAGCGSDDKEENKIGSLKSSIESGLKMDKYTYEGSMGVSVEGKDFFEAMDEEVIEIFGITNNKIWADVTFKGSVADENADVSLGISINDKIKEDILKLMVVDENAYINIKTLQNGITGIVKEITDQDISDVFSENMPEGEYLKLTEEMLLNNLEFTGDLNGIMGQVANGADRDKYSEFVEYLAELLSKGIKKGSGDAYSNSGDKYKLTINNHNVNEIMSGIVEIFTAKSSEISEKINTILGEEVIDGDTLSSTLSMLNSYDITSIIDADFQLEIESEFVDGKWDFAVTFSVSEDDNKLNFYLKYSAAESDDISISAPTDLISDEDAEELINALTEGFGADSSSNDDDKTGEDKYQVVKEITKDDTKAKSEFGISGKFSDAQFYYNGSLLSAKDAKVKDLVAAGFELENNVSVTDKVEEDYFGYCYEKSYDGDFVIYMFNKEDKTIDLGEANVYYLSAETYNLDDSVEEPELYIMGDITFGTSDEYVLQIMGNPTTAYEYPYIATLEYLFEDENNNSYVYGITIQDGVVVGIEIEAL